MSEFIVAIRVPHLDIGMTVSFSSLETLELIESSVLVRVSGARLPVIDWRRTSIGSKPAFHVDAVDLGSTVQISYSGRFDTPSYLVERSGLHWDFWRIVTGCFMAEVLKRGTIPIHSAAVRFGKDVILLPGSSGAGKSSVAFAASALGAQVLASELTFVSDGRIVASNATMTIDPAALSRIGLELPAGAEQLDGRVVLKTSVSDAPVDISGVVFPRVATTDLYVREISARRARMLLFENVVTELPIGKLVVQETLPLGSPPTGAELATIAHQVIEIGNRRPIIVEGTPQCIAEYVEIAYR